MPGLVHYSAVRWLCVSKISNGGAHAGNAPVLISARTALYIQIPKNGSITGHGFFKKLLHRGSGEHSAVHNIIFCNLLCAESIL
jgi:hypothetical protein